ncbi:S1C family serine protease [Micromonospora sp. URMC 103]|uniref:S1C family serine protease n=1 Tax=Micromonospora sp. URMC 103 TaxID=3423406 RepID=UPI003F1A3356
MTAGYGSAGYGPGEGHPAEAGPHDPARATGDRPGPLPPRIEPARAAVPGWPAPPAPAPGPPTHPAAGGVPPQPAVPGVPPQPTPAAAPAPPTPAAAPPPPTGPGVATPPPSAAVPGQPTGPGLFMPPTGPGLSAPPPGPRLSAPPPGPGGAGPVPSAAGTPAEAGAAVPAPPAPPVGPAPVAYGPPTGPAGNAPFGSVPPAGPTWPAGTVAYPAQPAPPPAPRRRGRWLTVLAALVALALAGLAGFQAHQIDRLGDRLAATDRRLAEAQSDDGARLGGVEKRTEALEKQAGATFNPEAVASAALPSVFRVRAGQFTGTAFAIGKPAAGGGTNLFTNFHVVEAVWDGGGREVFLERTDQRFAATIVKVDKTNDVAQLRTTGRFTGLVAAPEAVKSGQQIVVVGAPLGLEDSVTTGVVSAFRDARDGSGPVLQFDAPINPGNSGGPVINGSKQVVGIATAKARDAEGIGLAVPIAIACDGFKIC